MEKIQDGENEKKAIEDGKRVLERILKKFDGKEREIGLGLLSGLKKKEMGESLLGTCPKCGKNELRGIRSRAGKQFVGCSGYPECSTTYPLPQGAGIQSLGKACDKCGTPTIRVVRKERKPFDMCLDPTCETKKSWARPMQKADAGGQNSQAGQSKPDQPAAVQTEAPRASNLGAVNNHGLKPMVPAHPWLLVEQADARQPGAAGAIALGQSQEALGKSDSGAKPAGMGSAGTAHAPAPRAAGKAGTKKTGSKGTKKQDRKKPAAKEE